MDKAEKVCKVCGGKVLSGIAPCDGSYYQAEDDSCAAAKRIPSEIINASTSVQRTLS